MHTLIFPPDCIPYFLFLELLYLCSNEDTTKIPNSNSPKARRSTSLNVGHVPRHDRQHSMPLRPLCTPASGYRNRPESPGLRSLPRPIVYVYLNPTATSPLHISGVDRGLARYDYRSSRPDRGALTVICHHDRIESPRLPTQSHPRETRTTVAVHCARTREQGYVNSTIQSLQSLPSILQS